MLAKWLSMDDVLVLVTTLFIGFAAVFVCFMLSFLYLGEYWIPIPVLK